MACQSSVMESSLVALVFREKRGNACPPFTAPVCLRLSFIGAVFLFRTVKLYRHAGTGTLTPRGQTQTRRLHDTWTVSHGLHTRARTLQHMHERALVEGHHRRAHLICVFICSVSPPSLSFHASCHPRPSPFFLLLEPALSPDGPGEKKKNKPLTLIFSALRTSWSVIIYISVVFTRAPPDVTLYDSVNKPSCMDTNNVWMWK